MTLWRTHIRLKVIESGAARQHMPGHANEKIRAGRQPISHNKQLWVSRSCYNFYLEPGCCMWIMSAVTQQNLLLTGKLTLKTSCTHTRANFSSAALLVLLLATEVYAPVRRGCRVEFYSAKLRLRRSLSLSHIHLLYICGEPQHVYAREVESFGGGWGWI